MGPFNFWRPCAAAPLAPAQGRPCRPAGPDASGASVSSGGLAAAPSQACSARGTTPAAARAAPAVPAPPPPSPRVSASARPFDQPATREEASLGRITTGQQQLTADFTSFTSLDKTRKIAEARAHICTSARSSDGLADADLVLI
jgi:hypothetical protein